MRLVVAPNGSESALGAGLTRVTGLVDYSPYADGQDVKVSTGQLRVGGEVLANPSSGPRRHPGGGRPAHRDRTGDQGGFKRIVVAGQLLAPWDSQQVLAPAVTVRGQLTWYRGQPRFFVGKEPFGRSFFELLDKPMTLTLGDSFEIDSDVPLELLRSKVEEITLVGKLLAPSHLIGALQVLTTEKVGKIMVTEDDTEPR